MMDVEIITIGDELLSGHTVDTNAAFVARQLNDIGCTLRYRSSCGDSLEQMEEAFKLALRRARVVITTGGLGPTEDDNTKKAIVKVFKRNLIFLEEVLEEVKARFARRGVEMPPINQNQALLPQGATYFPNDHGSAVGIMINEKGKTFIALPGVPKEMEQITVDSVIPYLKGLRGGQAIEVVTLRTTGIGESKLTEHIAPELKLEPGVKLAYLPNYGGVDLRVTTFDEKQESASTKTADLVRYLEAKVGKFIFGRNDDTLESVIGQLLKDNDLTLAVAESCTAGQLGNLITKVSGSSDYFQGGIISYSNDAKVNLLGVDAAIIEEHGAVSEECAVAMAEGCRQKFGSGYALSVTGIAGPSGGTDEKPVGTTWIGLSSGHAKYAKKFAYGTNRNVNRTRAAYAALELLRREILDIK